MGFIPNATAYENYIREGTTWVMQSSHDITPGDNLSDEYEYKITGTENIGGYEALKVVRGSNENFVGYLRTEGDRVYFSMDGKPDSWRLAYDFGLQPGDECEIYLFGIDNNQKHKVICEGIYESPDNPDLELMSMRLEHYEAAEGIWIKGLGSYWGLTDWTGLVGGGETMLQAWSDDKMIYLQPAYMYFDNGTAWTTLTDPSDKNSTVIQRLNIDKEGRMQLYTRTAQEKESLLCYLKVEGQQVYFSTLENPDEWMLCYDFNMRPGEKREFYSLSNIGDEPQKVECECREIHLYPQDLGYSEMVLVNTQNPEIEYRWLRGLCSLDGFTYNVTDGPRDAQTVLYEIKSGKYTIFSNRNAALGSVETDAVDFSLDGMTLTVGAQESATVYTPDGRIVATGTTLNLPATGLYIVRLGTHASKLLVR